MTNDTDEPDLCDACEMCNGDGTDEHGYDCPACGGVGYLPEGDR